MSITNPVLDIIKSRRSIRKYQDRPIDGETLNAIIEAGFYAPSAMNRKPWHVVVVDDWETLLKIPSLQPYTSMVPTAACVLFVCGDESVSGQFYIDDCAAVTQNILLAAASLGIGSCWCGVEHTGREAAFSELLNLPENIRPYSLVALGYPDEVRAAPERFDTSRIHRNRW